MNKHPNVWKELTTTAEGDDLLISGLNPWKHTWHCLGEFLVNLPNQAFPDQLYERHVYKISDGNNSTEFVAYEVSANVWRFWIPIPRNAV